jgi:hypothetical protein
MRSEQSYRTIRNIAIATHLGLSITPTLEKDLPDWQDIPQLRRDGINPYYLIERITEHYGLENKMVQECLRAIGAGSSPWIQISNFLLNIPSRSKLE